VIRDPCIAHACACTALWHAWHACMIAAGSGYVDVARLVCEPAYFRTLYRKYP